MDSRRQQKISSLIKEEFSDILLRNGKGIYGKAFVTITNVKVTPDIAIARFYLSIYNVENTQLVLEQMQEHKGELKRELGNKLRHSLRSIPDLEFYIDDTLDYVFKMEELFKEINKKD